MHLLGALLAVLGAWMILSVPAALVAGRFLRVASAPRAARGVQRAARDSFDTTAA